MGNMSRGILVGILIVALFASVYSAETNPSEAAALSALAENWERSSRPYNWLGGDPCGSGWTGVKCANSSVTVIQLASIGLAGTLSGDIGSLTELQTLDLSYNPSLTGQLPDDIGKLTKLHSLVLVGCGFSGPIPDLGSLKELFLLILTSNKFTGNIPPSVGSLTSLYLLDLADNQLTGTIPISKGTFLGLDNLKQTAHFHFSNNQLSGGIPAELFHSDMEKLIHVLFDNNSLTGSIPPTLGLVKALEVIRLDGNKLTGPVPTNINNLTKLGQLYLSNNKLTGPLPNLTGMSSLSYVDLSNNSFDASDVPPWFSTLQSLTTLVMESLRIQGEPPAGLFTIPQLQTVRLKDNRLNGTLNMTSYSKQLSLVDLSYNKIRSFVDGGTYDKKLILVETPYCIGKGFGYKFCMKQDLVAPPKLILRNCSNDCFQEQKISPNCRCAYPYVGTFFFRAPQFSDLGNISRYSSFEAELMDLLKKNVSTVESVYLSNISWEPGNYLQIGLQIFPANAIPFSQYDISIIGFLLSNQYFQPPGFGTYYFKGLPYSYFQEIDSSSKSRRRPLIFGVAAGGFLLITIITILVLYSLKQRSKAKKAVSQSHSFASWDKDKSSGSFPQLQGARWFSFNELKQCTNNFSDANDIGSGGYGRVYRGTLSNGQLVAVKRAQQESMQGAPEFKTEIELLSRVHHKNLVSLLGFCTEKDEQVLVYEYVPNGSLKDCLSGKSGIHMDWKRRLQVSLGAARGLAYLHDSANPPIVHRDIKSSNILLDDRLNAKVSDFGLCKALNRTDNKHHVSTQVKGTMGYLDPEYYMTQQLTEKSDVYSFGVLLLEMITGKKPIERNQYIVRQVIIKLDKSQDLYGLHDLIDPVIASSPSLKGFQKFVDLAMQCVQELGAERPTMTEVVKEIQTIMQTAGLTPNNSAPNSSSYEMGSPYHHNPYSNEAVASFTDTPVPR